MFARRAVTFVTLTVLLLAVAGVTFAQEGVAGSQQPADDAVEANTMPEKAKPEKTKPKNTAPGRSAAGSRNESTPPRKPPAQTSPPPREPTGPALSGRTSPEMRPAASRTR